MSRAVVSAALMLCPLAAQSPAPNLGRPTERPSAETITALKSGPALPYRVDTNWPQMPKGYNFGECSGVAVEKNGNVWVFNRG